MKTQPPLTATLAALLAVAAAFPAAAAHRDYGPYFSFDGGPSWAQSVSAKVQGIAGTADFDVGGRFSMDFGYHFNRYAGVEFETAWIWNGFKDSSTDLSQVPFLVNAVFRLPTRFGLEPYIGAGVGGSYSMVTIEEDYYYCCVETDADFVFAWQGMAGVRYNFNENLSVGVGYKYLSSSASDYDVGGLHLKLDTVHNHSAGIVLNFNF